MEKGLNFKTTAMKDDNNKRNFFSVGLETIRVLSPEGNQ